MGVETWHTHLQGYSQPAPAEAAGSGLSTRGHWMASGRAGVEGPP